MLFGLGRTRHSPQSVHTLSAAVCSDINSCVDVMCAHCYVVCVCTSTCHNVFFLLTMLLRIQWKHDFCYKIPCPLFRYSLTVASLPFRAFARSLARSFFYTSEITMMPLKLLISNKCVDVGWMWIAFLFRSFWSAFLLSYSKFCQQKPCLFNGKIHICIWCSCYIKR